jgi:hypothetical protein
LEKKKSAYKKVFEGMGQDPEDMKVDNHAIPFNVHVMKNRGAPEGDKVEMVFNAPVLSIAEKDKSAGYYSGF